MRPTREEVLTLKQLDKHYSKKSTRRQRELILYKILWRGYYPILIVELAIIIYLLYNQ